MGSPARQYSFNTQPPEGGWGASSIAPKTSRVSTHSRPKAAGSVMSYWVSQMSFQHTAARRRLESLMAHRRSRESFNTQPPEGGWNSILI